MGYRNRRLESSNWVGQYRSPEGGFRSPISLFSRTPFVVFVDLLQCSRCAPQRAQREGLIDRGSAYFFEAQNLVSQRHLSERNGAVVQSPMLAFILLVLDLLDAYKLALEKR